MEFGVDTRQFMIRVVAALLLAWEPFSFAVEALTVLPTIAYRGWLASIELACHALVAALAASGGLALWNRTSSARRLATIAIVLSVARTVQTAWWSTLPSATVPGSEPFIAIIAALIGAVCLALLHVSTSARST